MQGPKESTANLSVRDTLYLLESQGLEGLSKHDPAQDVDVAAVVLFAAQNNLPLPRALVRSLLASPCVSPEYLDSKAQKDPALYSSCLELLNAHPRLVQRLAAVSMTGLVREGLVRVHPTHLDYSQSPTSLKQEDLSFFLAAGRHDVLVWCRALPMVPVESILALCRRSPQVFDAVVEQLCEQNRPQKEKGYEATITRALADDQVLWSNARPYQAGSFLRACYARKYPVSWYGQMAVYASGSQLAHLWDDPDRDPLELTRLWYLLSTETRADVVESLAPTRLDNDPTPAQKDACERFLNEAPQPGIPVLRSLAAPFNSPLKHAVRNQLVGLAPQQRAVLELLLPLAQAPFAQIVASLRLL